MGDIHLDFWQFEVLVGVKRTQVYPVVLMVPATAALRHHSDGFGGCYQLLLVAFMAFLPALFELAFGFFPFGLAIRRIG